MAGTCAISCIFIFFDIILGLSGLAVIAGGVLIFIDKKSFNSLAVILVVIGLIIFLIFIIGIKIHKKPILLGMYLFFVTIIFLFYAGLSVLVKLYPEQLIENLQKRVDEVEDEEFNKINEYNTYIFIGTCIGAGCTLLSIITGIIYYKKLKNNNNDTEYIDSADGNKKDVLHGIDYSINNQEEEKNDISN